MVLMAFWQKYGLVAPGWFRSLESEPRYAALQRAARFRLALEEKGGLFPRFGRFLAGRADLLPSEHLSELRKIKMPALPSSSEPPEDLKQLVPDLRIIRITPGGRVFSGSYDGGQVVVEVVGTGDDASRDREWDAFQREVRKLNDKPESAVSRDSVVQQFRDWLQLQENLERKRTMLANLQDVIPDTVSKFPKTIAELQSPGWMGYESTVGDPIDKLLLRSDDKADVLHVLAEGFLEQCLLFSLVDSEFHVEELLVIDKGRLGFRTLPAWVTVPVESHQDLLQYLVAAVAGDTPRAVRMICRMAAGRDSYLAEQRLLNELSSLQPELKIGAVTPESVTALETYTRAMSHSDMVLPPFLRLFHRNITLIGQYNELFAPAVDMIDQALWPVLGRLLRFHIAEVLSSGKVQEWAISSSLFFLTAGRQMAVTLEKLRENDDRITPAPDIRGYGSRDAQLNRRTVSLIRSLIVLVVFLFSAQASMSPGEGLVPIVAGVVAAVSAITLCFSVAGIR
jgi:predicted unusual protein kinase regulating ubiquinone biosynthesis (AarF/ABC1/UbiB family)